MGLQQNISASVFSAVVIKYSNKRSFRGGGGEEEAHFSSQFKVTVISMGEVTEAGAWGSWSQCSHSKEAERRMHACAQLPFSIYAVQNLGREWFRPQWESLLISTKIIPHSYAQRPISRVRADVCQVEINVYINSVCSRSGAPAPDKTDIKGRGEK